VILRIDYLADKGVGIQGKRPMKVTTHIFDSKL